MSNLNSWSGLIKHFSKIIFLSILDAMALWGVILLLSDHSYIFLFLLMITTIFINYVYLSEKIYPLRYILPGTLFMLILVVYPIFYNIYISFTNYGTGHVLSKEQVIRQLEERYYIPSDSEEYKFTAFKSPEEKKFILLLEDREGNLYLGNNGKIIPVSSSSENIFDSDNDGDIDKINGYKKLLKRDLFKNLGFLQEIEFIRDNESIIKMKDILTYVQYRRQYKYLPGEDKIIDIKNNVDYSPVEGFFVSPEGDKLMPGFRTYVGWRNYLRLINSKSIATPFLRVFLWTFEFAFLSVLGTFLIGLLLAIILNDNKLFLKRIYRTLLILPYAIPGFISILIWRGLFNEDFGVINNILKTLTISPISWLTDATWAKVALILVNLWLGYPYMMLIILGSLQSINKNLYEAAAIDGASAWQKFRHITLPLILVSVGPLLISSFAFNFNNYVVIYLFNEGRPPMIGADTPAGKTDILITYTYRLAFETGQGADFGLASTVTILIFLITATITWVNFRFTGTLEDVKENE